MIVRSFKAFWKFLMARKFGEGFFGGYILVQIFLGVLIFSPIWSSLSLKIPLAPGLKIRPLTNPGKKICGFKNLQIRVDGACIWKSMRISYSKETGKSWNLYTVPWTGILTSFLTDRLSPEWMISVANNRHRMLRKPSSYPDKGNSFNSGNVTPSEFLKTVILIVQHRLF